jgi:TRAP-type C4-dicarboxylate transport system permease small subunit
MEPISILFLWTVLFGSCYAFRTDQHIKFSLFYDKMPKRYAELTAFIGNLIVLVLMVLSFVPSVKFIDFMKIQSSSVLRISMRIIYLPYLIFLAISIIYTACEMKSEWKNVLKGKKASQRKDET